MAKRKVTKADLIKALADNGYRQIQSRLIDTDYTDNGPKILGACAIGQAALNLGVGTGELDSALKMIDVDYRNLRSHIIHMNDDIHNRPQTIAKKLAARKDFADFELYLEMVDYSINTNYRGVTVPEEK